MKTLRPFLLACHIRHACPGGLRRRWCGLVRGARPWRSKAGRRLGGHEVLIAPLPGPWEPADWGARGPSDAASGGGKAAVRTSA